MSDDLIRELYDRAASYEASGPSAAHTAELLRRAADELKRTRADLRYAYLCVDDGFGHGRFDFSVLRGRARAFIRIEHEQEMAHAEPRPDHGYVTLDKARPEDVAY